MVLHACVRVFGDNKYNHSIVATIYHSNTWGQQVLYSYHCIYVTYEEGIN